MVTRETMVKLARVLKNKGISRQDCEMILSSFDTDEQLQKMIEAVESSKNPSRSYILAKALLIADPD